MKIIVLLLLLLILIIPYSLFADQSFPYVEGEILVKFKSHVQDNAAGKRQTLDTMNVNVVKHLPLNDIYLVKVSGAESVSNAINRLKGHPGIEHAEPNYKKYLMAITPNDPLFSLQWALQKIHSTEAWQLEQGKKSIVIAIADTGIDITHQDLNANLWFNTGEIFCNNGIDDDKDGYVDDCSGINTITGSGNPMDDEGHGTHVSGIAGALGNNGIGISGVNWHVSLMALKFIGADGTGTLADELEAIEFARQKGVEVFNMSFGGYGYSDIEKQAMTNAGGILFVAAACNDASNNDYSPCYPASYDLPNLISAAASDQNDNLASFSNYGRNSVSVAAPGVSIESTYLGNTYQSLNGTSMSTPFVSGLAALILARNPGLSVAQLKDRILRTVDIIPALQGKTLTGGRINAYRALTESVVGPYIYSISPERGPVGSNITIRGSNFKTITGKVIFEGGIEAPVSFWSNEKIIVQVPQGAITGLIRVTTSEGTSNGVNFEVTLYPVNMRIVFPYASTEAGQASYVVLSNPLDHSIVVNVQAVGTSGDITLKIITLNAYERNYWNLRGWLLNETGFVDCVSDELFGAALVSISDDLTRVIAIPPIFGVH